MPRGEQQILGIWAQLERKLGEPIKGRVHGLLYVRVTTHQATPPTRPITTTAVAPPSTTCRRRSRRRSAVVCIIGTSANTGNASDPVTSSSVLRLLSRSTMRQT